MHKKILITGNAGPGKTTLSYEVAKLLNIKEVIHLDKFVWGESWQPVEKEIKEKSFSDIANKDSWVVDGVSRTILTAADIIIFLDYPRYLCYFRALRRTFKYAFRPRPELPEQPSDIFVLWKLLKIIWNFPKLVHPNIIDHLTAAPERKVFFHIRSKGDLLNMLNSISNLDVVQ